jgi:hypothetical protein
MRNKNGSSSILYVSKPSKETLLHRETSILTDHEKELWLRKMAFIVSRNFAAKAPFFEYIYLAVESCKHQDS